MDGNITQHFRPEEHDLIETLSSKAQIALDQNRFVLTDFLNPREQYILTTLVNRIGDLLVTFNGGFENAENKRALIYPEYFSPEESDFSVQLMEIDYPVKFAELQHRQILGSLANAGINRNTFGDIVFEDNRWQFAIESELNAFFTNEITRIGKIKVKLVTVNWSDRLTITSDWQPTFETTTSLRIDSLISTGFGISRNKAKELVEGNRVQLNWMSEESPDKSIELNDVISVRKYGRIRLVNVLGKTKKDKLKVQLDLIKTKL